MDIHSEYMEPVTPGLTYDNVGYWKTEDSGYHTSYTPGSLECSELSSENFNPTIFQSKIGFTGQFQVGCYDIQSDVNFRPTLQFSTGIIRSQETHIESPQNRRGVKRAYNGEPDNRDHINYGSIPTPTSMIAGGLCKLRFSDKKLNTSYSSGSFDSADFLTGDLYSRNEHIHTPYPTTPIKKVCRNNCKLSSPLNPRKPVKKLNFAIHSLSCDRQALQPIVKSVKLQNNADNAYKFRPNQKIDIIKMLYQEANVMPPVMKIFNYLSNEDIYKFTLVSPLWQKVWEDVSKVKTKKQEYLHYLKDVRDNQENKMSTPKNIDTIQIRPLMEIHNVLNNHNVINKTTSTPISPPGTPKTIRFKRFAKAASLDIRKQLCCVRCQKPAKITEESSGEEWVECTSVTCSYQFCRFCKCDRHPGKNCFKYDLDGPSPSKRKKNTCAVGTKKSRKNLRRLL
ncbi:uncharacterized protein LOC120631821 [Pararge aegeria]|uniref:Jg11534 protein n=1 Tax=Pararge aegeria aegeria TaxID=348720 RepID=A0A8S4RN38_9NEOP|nr:uncharacterized protein LOC120631821 [Pararge aegeria]CAH2238255.1 jg11534 [Pararge aegeria aegeria]